MKNYRRYRVIRDPKNIEIEAENLCSRLIGAYKAGLSQRPGWHILANRTGRSLIENRKMPVLNELLYCLKDLGYHQIAKEVKWHAQDELRNSR